MNKSFVFLLLLLLLFLLVAIFYSLFISWKIIFTYEWPLVPFITFRAQLLILIIFHLPSSVCCLLTRSIPYPFHIFTFTTSSQYLPVLYAEQMNEWVRIFYCGIFRSFSAAARYLFYIFIFCVIFYWNIFGFHFHFHFFFFMLLFMPAL